MKNVDIVISYYKEDLSWVDDLDITYINKIYIYNKSGDDRYIPLPNIGLDSHTHLYHIVNNFHNLSENIIFLQGNPFDHQCEPRNVHDINMWMKQLQTQKYTSNYYVSCLDAGLYNGKINNWNGHNLKDTGYNIYEWVERFLKMSKNTMIVPIYFSCQFGVNKSLIYEHDIELYRSLLSQHDEQHVEVTHFMERVWGILFKITPQLLTNNIQMINFNFVNPSTNLPEGRVEISLDETSRLFLKNEQFPLTLTHKKFNKVVWALDLYPNWFSHYVDNSYTTINIVDSFGNNIFNWSWDVNLHGDFCHRFFEHWSNQNKGSNGIAIGTHDGTSGEWVGPVINNKLRATLVEASETQYNELLSLYKGYPWVVLKNKLVTTDGGDYTFYEGGLGLTNSLHIDLIEKYVDKKDIIGQKKSSISINELIDEASINGEVKWIHMDVEGIDGELIYSIDDKKLPEVLIFESLNMTEDYKLKLFDYLRHKEYNLVSSGYNTVCFRM